ncbi:MAG: tetratricopeptide repeat protein [Planctomycetota bacterium]|nr:tetratricopeptide repeat protein [Planctomycetota bacterium]
MPSIAQLEKLLAADPNDPFVLYALAQEHAKHGATDTAVDFFDRCLAADPTYLYAYYHKARVQLEAGRADDARAALRTGIAAATQAGDAKALNELRALALDAED